HARGARADAHAAHPQGRLPRPAAEQAHRRGARDARPCRRPPGAPARGGPCVTAALRRSTHSLAIPNYRRWFAGQVVSISGNWMQTVAEMWLVVHLTGNGVAVGISATLHVLPLLILHSIRGVHLYRHLITYNLL